MISIHNNGEPLKPTEISETIGGYSGLFRICDVLEKLSMVPEFLTLCSF